MPAGQHDAVGRHRFERGAHVDLDAALLELVRGIVAEPRRDLREDLRRRVDEHPAPRHALQPRVVARCIVREVGELRERLDACVSRSDEDEGEPALSLLLVGHGVGGLELAEHVIAQVDRLREGLEREAMLGEPRDRHDTRDRAERDHELVPAHGLHADLGVDLCSAFLEVDPGHAADQQVGVGAHHAKRHDRVPRLERSRRRLGQKRRVEHEVLEADDRRAARAEQPRDVRAGEAPAEDQHASLRVALHRHLFYLT